MKSMSLKVDLTMIKIANRITIILFIKLLYFYLENIDSRKIKTCTLEFI